ncbi:MAG: ABC transporter ATP-binding protein [Verrucomicrobiaceae bacterium]|jgi:ABC-type lipoprotein export system ATPase subunit|nr:ABC transporter ATP-binding protein [Verrucomicrobiaceae bacterium]
MNSDLVLSAVDVKKSFKTPDGDSIEVLRGATISIKAGESVALRGESGSGKTTFMNIISCLESVSSGEVFWLGKRVDNLSNSAQAKLRSGFMGFVFQNYCLMPELTALENVLLASRILGKCSRKEIDRAKDLLNAVGLSARLNYLPNRLSGGERQRVAIARAIINSPSVMLADEPTGNLDEDTANSVMNMLLELCKNNNTALLLITHNPDFAKITDREVLLSHGEILEVR